MFYARCVGLAKDVAYPLNTTPSSQATRSNPGKAKNYEPKALNETMQPMRRKKSLIISHTSTGHHQFLLPFQPKRKNRNVRKKRDPHVEQEK